MTNTETHISNFDKVAALVDVEAAGLYTGLVTDAINAGLDEGYLECWPSGTGLVAVRLTTAGRERLAGFRALFS